MHGTCPLYITHVSTRGHRRRPLTFLTFPSKTKPTWLYINNNISTWSQTPPLSFPNLSRQKQKPRGNNKSTWWQTPPHFPHRKQNPRGNNKSTWQQTPPYHLPIPLLTPSSSLPPKTKRTRQRQKHVAADAQNGRHPPSAALHQTTLRPRAAMIPHYRPSRR
jgi:hypothetical protein